MAEAPESESAPANVKDAAPSRRSRWMARVKRLKRLKGPIVAIAAGGTVIGGLAGYWNGWRTVNTGIAQVTASTTKAAGPVVPFSAADRRMTFAVLPFQAPTGDAEGARLALAAFEVTLAEQEANILWGRVVPRTLVEAQMARPQTLSQLGRSLDTHFLYRGNVTRSSAGYALDLAVIDAATERVLEQHTIKADAGVGGPQLPAAAIQDATHYLTYFALKQEVARARSKPDAQLDVRDLAFRAKVDWADDYLGRAEPAAAYAAAMKSLKRAAELAPGDLLTLQLTAQINMCECLRTWAADTRPMEDIGVAAIDKGLTLRPDWPSMQGLRFWHYFKHGRYPEALLVNDALRAKSPDDAEVLMQRVMVLRSMGEVAQALALVPAMLKTLDHEATLSVAADVYFAHGDDTEAARLARKALVRMTRAQRADPDPGSVALVLVAAESRAGQLDRARAAFKDFQDVVPKAQTVGLIKAWLQPSWVAPGGDAFWEALKRAGVAG